MWRTESFEVARGVEPDDIPAAELAWWRDAYAEFKRRCWALDVSNPRGGEVTAMERRKDRFRKPGH